MPRKIPWPPPVYSRGGRDFVRLRLGPGRYRDITLGPAGSAESRAEYARILAEVQVNGGRVTEPGADRTVLEVCVAYLEWARGYHEHRQFHRIKTALGPVRSLYGRTPAERFGPLALQTVRAQFVSDGYAREYCNTLTNCVRGCFRWAAGEQLVPHAVAAALADVAPLRKKKTTAPERPRIRPVALEVVEATLPHLPPIPQDMIRLQLWTGARPGEVCAMRPCDLERPWKVIDGVELWLYRLDQHKTDWKGIWRWIPIEPRAQQLLTTYLTRSPDSYCFSPRETYLQWCKEHGRTPNLHRRSRNPGDHYKTEAYDDVIRRACIRAGLPCWSPNQLRHGVLTEVEVEYSREDARCVAGHTTPGTTARYVEAAERAARVVAGRYRAAMRDSSAGG